MFFSYSPPTVLQGDTLTVVTATGTRFGTTPGTVRFIGIYTATIVSRTDTQIQFQINQNTPAANPISVTYDAPDTGVYKEYGKFGIMPNP